MPNRPFLAAKTSRGAFTLIFMSTLTLPDAATAGTRPRPRLRVLFFVEGFTDIRFVIGLSEIADVTMLVASDAYRSSGLRDRVLASGARLTVDEIPGGRLAFQLKSIPWLLRHARPHWCLRF